METLETYSPDPEPSPGCRQELQDQDCLTYTSQESERSCRELVGAHLCCAPWFAGGAGDASWRAGN